MRPRVVERPIVRPHKCAIFPYIYEDPDGFVDTGTNMFNDRVYLSAKGLREVVKLFGWPNPESAQELSEANERLGREVENLKLQLREADRELSAVEVFKQSPRWKEARAPGRPRKGED